MLRTLLLAAPLALVACTSKDMAESWQIDRLRILAVRPEPAEPGPGQTVTFSSLTISPTAALEGVAWFACLASEGDDYGCALDLSGFEDLSADLEGLDPADLTPEQMADLYTQMQEMGLIGFEPLLPPSFTVPEDVLDGLSEEQALEGLNLMVTLLAIPEGATSEADMEIAYKRVPVSASEHPNTNPTIGALLVEQHKVASDTPVTVAPGQAVRLEPVLSSSSIEDYAYLNSSGEWEDRTEEPYFQYYLEEGEFSQEYALYPYSGTTWHVPEIPTRDELTVWVVVQDRRGGMGWWTQRFLVE